MLTQETLKDILRYDQETGDFTWLISPRYGINIGDVAGSKHHSGYWNIMINRIKYSSHRLAWMYMYGYSPENQIDHIDRDRGNNAITNLREVTRSCNLRNTGNPKNNTSGIKGVSLHKATGKWRARISILGKLIYIGLYDSKIEAACARLSAEQCVNWEGCDSSSPVYKFVKDNIERVV